MPILTSDKKRPKEVKKWEKEVKKGNARWDTYLSLARWYLDTKEEEKFIHLLNNVKEESLSEILKAFEAIHFGNEEEALSLIPEMDVEGNEKKAWVSLLRGLAGELEALQETLALYPRHPWEREIRKLLGIRLLEKRRGEEILGYLIPLEGEKDPEVHYILGKAYIEIGNALAARRYLERALPLAQGEMKGETALLLAGLYGQKEEWDKVATSLKVALPLAPASERKGIKKRLMEALIRSGREEEAEKMLEKLEDEREEFLILLAQRYEAKGKWEDALKMWKQVIAPVGRLGEGRSLFHIQKYEEASSVLEGALNGGGREEALYLLALIAFQQKDYKRSWSCLNRLEDLQVHHLLLLRAKAALAMKMWEESTSAAIRALELASEDEKRQTKAFLKGLRRELEKVPKGEHLLPLIQEAIKEAPFFQRLKKGLIRSRHNLASKLEEALGIEGESTEEVLNKLEEVLITADVGVQTTQNLRKAVRRKVERGEARGREGVLVALKEEILKILRKSQGKLEISAAPWVIMVVGVNGTGKTTTIAKLAWRLKDEGRSVLLAAGDTFRAAAIEQLDIWAQRVGVPIIKQRLGSDPSGVVFDALKAAESRGTDVVIIDTAGRLHTKVNLMEELKKMVRVASREVSGAPQEILLVLDATTGQNALSQARLFCQAVPVTGLALTKLDGTAKGGIIIAIAGELSMPIKLIGIGEGMGDLQDFDAEAFVEALFEVD